VRRLYAPSEAAGQLVQDEPESCRLTAHDRGCLWSGRLLGSLQTKEHSLPHWNNAFRADTNMPIAMDQVKKKAKVIRTADESETFEANVTIHVDGLVGSATISPSGRDVALAS
jgi:hypothetical protein